MRIYFLWIVFSLFAYNAYSQSVMTETDSFYKRGELYKVIDSDSICIVAHLQPVRKYGKYYRLSLIIGNKLHDRIEFIPSDISVKYHTISRSNKLKKKDAKVYTYEEYATKANGRISAAAVISGLGAVAQALSTAPDQTVTYRTNTGYMGSINVYSQYERNRQNQENFQRVSDMEMANRSYVDAIKDSYLLRETLFRESELIGCILIRYKECNDLVSNIKLGEKHYRFTWHLKDKENVQAMDEVYY